MLNDSWYLANNNTRTMYTKRKDTVKIVKAPEVSKKSSAAETCDRISKISIYLLVFLLPLLFLPWTANVLEFNKQTLLIILVFVSTFAWLLKILISGKIKFSLNYVHIPIGALLLIYLASTLFSFWKYGSFWGWPQVTSESFVTILSLSLLYLLIVNIFEKKEVFYLISSLIFSAGLAVVYGILQIFGQFIMPIGFTRVKTFNTVGSVNTLGILAAVFLPVSLMLFMVSKEKVYRILFAVCVLAFAVLALIINFYLVWWLLIAGSALIFAFGTQRRDIFDNRWLILPMFFLAVALLFSFFRFSIPGIPQTPVEFSLKHKATFSIAGNALKENLIIGTGPGTFSYNFAKYKSQSFNQTSLWDIDFDWGGSKFLTILATTGILGTLGFLSLIGFFIFYGIKFLFNKKESENLSFYWSFGAGIFISFLVLSISFFLYSSNTTLDFTYFVLIACLVALLCSEKKEFELKPSSLSTLGFTFAITVVFVFGLGLFIMQGQRYVSSISYLNGIEAWQKGKTDNALAKFERAVSISPGVDLYWREMAEAYLRNIDIASKKKDLDQEQKRQAVQLSINKAVNAAKTATSANPKNVSNWSLRGSIYQGLIGIVGETKDWSVSAFKEAAKLEPKNPFYLTQAGISILKYVGTLDNTETKKKDNLLAEAKEFFDRALELKSDYAPAHFQLARIYLDQGREDEMINSLQEAKEAAPRDIGLAFQLGLIFYQKGEFEKARVELERAVVLNPNYANALYFLGLTYDGLGQKDMAIKIFEKVLKLNPGHPIATQVLNNLKAGKQALAGIAEEEPPVAPIEEEK